MLKKPPAERLKLLRESSNPQAQFLWAILRDSFHYAAVHLADIAETRARRRLRDALGLRHEARARSSCGSRPAGSRWPSGSRTTSTPARRCRKRAAAGLGVRRPGRERRRAHARRLVEPDAGQATSPRSTLPVYQRQPFPESVLGAGAADAAEARHRGVQERRDPRLDARRRGADRQHHRQAAPDQPGRDRGPAEGASSSPKPGYKGLVIWSPDDVFSAGANLEALMPVFMKMRRQGHRARGEEAAGRDAAPALRAGAGGRGDARHRAGRRLRDSRVYCAQARRGDGNLHRPGRSRRRPGARRRRPGLHRAPRRRDGRRGNANADLLQVLTDGFTTAAMAKVGTSAIEIAQARLPAGSDVIVPHKDELLHRRASQQAKAMADERLPRAGARRCSRWPAATASPPSRRQLANMRDGGFISAHDFHIASLIADVVCGGDVDAGSLVPRST